MSAIKIAASWCLLYPTHACRPFIKRPNHSVYVGAVVKDSCPLPLRTDCAVDPPSALAMNMLYCMDRALRSEDNFSLDFCLPGLLELCRIQMSTCISPSYSVGNEPIGCRVFENHKHTQGQLPHRTLKLVW